MNSLDRCARCGSDDIETRPVERMVRGGSDAAVVSVEASVCRNCGERFFPIDAIREMESTRKRLERGDVAGFRSLGRLFRGADTAVRNG
jgi:YgiT-type zinc finger domain-containing protein